MQTVEIGFANMLPPSFKNLPESLSTPAALELSIFVYDTLQAVRIKRLMLQFQEVLLIYKIEFWCELTIAIRFWENVDLCFG